MNINIRIYRDRGGARVARRGAGLVHLLYVRCTLLFIFECNQVWLLGLGLRVEG